MLANVALILGRMTENNALAERHAVLIDGLMAGLSVRAAGEAAGYAGTGVYQALGHPSVLHGVLQGVRRYIVLEGAPAAYRLLHRVVNDENVATKTRVEAAKTLLSIAGFVAPKAADPDRPGEKGLHDMTPEELKGFIAKARSELANRAQVIDVAPASAPVSSQSADMFE